MYSGKLIQRMSKIAIYLLLIVIPFSVYVPGFKVSFESLMDIMLIVSKAIPYVLLLFMLVKVLSIIESKYVYINVLVYIIFGIGPHLYYSFSLFLTSDPFGFVLYYFLGLWSIFIFLLVWCVFILPYLYENENAS